MPRMENLRTSGLMTGKWNSLEKCWLKSALKLPTALWTEPTSLSPPICQFQSSLIPSQPCCSTPTNGTASVYQHSNSSPNALELGRFMSLGVKALVKRPKRWGQGLGARFQSTNHLQERKRS